MSTTVSDSIAEEVASATISSSNAAAVIASTSSSAASAAAAAAAAMRVKVTSYNVLSSHLSSPAYFTACAPEYCDPDRRYQKLIEKLDVEIQSHSVICLQEVSNLWAGYLHTYFAARGYHFITSLYGNKFNGYMGVGIAVPLHKFDIATVDITRIADVKRMPRKPREDFSLVSRILRTVYHTFRSGFLKIAELLKWYKPAIDMWESALYRHNQMICTRLQCKSTGKAFVVGTYHMPCMFQLPSVMNVHCALSAQHIQNFSKADPFIYVGDFNIKPDSSQYGLLTNGTLPVTHPDYPHAVAGDDWTPDIQQPFKSAYMVKNGAEPDFTNYAKIKEDPVFIATLDYIFHSKEWNVDEVEPLKPREMVAGPLPNQDEPSDHVLISAQMSLPPSNA